MPYKAEVISSLDDIAKMAAKSGFPTRIDREKGIISILVGDKWHDCRCWRDVTNATLIDGKEIYGPHYLGPSRVTGDP